MLPVTDKCRCCLGVVDHEDYFDNDYYSYIIKETLNVLRNSDPRLPKHICSNCAVSIERAKSFRDMVVKSERELLRALDAQPNTVETTQPLHDVWIREQVCVVVQDESTTAQPSDGVRSHDDAEMKKTVSNSSLIRDLDNSLSMQSVEEGDSRSDSSDIPLHDTDEETFHVDTNSMGSGNGEEVVRHCPITDGKNVENAPATKEFSTKRSGELAFQNTLVIVPGTFVIVPEVSSMQGNFTRELPAKGFVANEKRSVTQPSFDESGVSSKKRMTPLTKLRENIILIMQHSTIVPFLHTSSFVINYICYYCEKTYISMTELREHTESQHVGKVSDEAILSFMRSRAHKLINADISRIKCRLCGVLVQTIETLVQHLIEIHKKMYHNTGEKLHGILGFKLSSDELKCHLCSISFDNFRSLKSHMKEHYEAYICYFCQKKFVNQHLYQTHLKNHIIRDVEDWKCNQCGVSSKSKRGLIYHTKRHHSNVTLKCKLCPETFLFKEYRKRDEHMLEVHGMKKPGPKYTCDICQNGKGFKCNNTLKIHKSNVHRIGDVLRIKCEICDFVTHLSKRMKEHMDVHNGVKNHGCDLCGKRFAKPHTLRMHMRIHLNDKRYACSQCDATYLHRSVLQYHVKKNHPDTVPLP